MLRSVGYSYLITMSTVTGESDEDGETSVVQEVFGEETQGRFGFNVGLGITFGNPEFITVDLYPMFNLVFLRW